VAASTARDNMLEGKRASSDRDGPYLINTERVRSQDNRDMQPSKRTIPNLAIAGGLGLAAIATYYYTLHAVGTSDIDAEVQKVLDSQKKSQSAQ
jgi:hypothetical protein